MQPFRLDRAKAERSLTDPDGALWPVNAYSDADELDSLIQAALDSAALARPNRRARLYIYPLSLSEPDPVLVYDPGHGRAFLGHALKLRDREGESPIDFTLRLLKEVIGDANALAAAPGHSPPDADAVRLCRVCGKPMPSDDEICGRCMDRLDRGEAVK
jgi:hypothetical protein